MGVAIHESRRDEGPRVLVTRNPTGNPPGQLAGKADGPDLAVLPPDRIAGYARDEGENAASPEEAVSRAGTIGHDGKIARGMGARDGCLGQPGAVTLTPIFNRWRFALQWVYGGEAVGESHVCGKAKLSTCGAASRVESRCDDSDPEEARPDDEFPREVNGITPISTMRKRSYLMLKI
jgi:hypothetical protein